jgi:hypothetical protein
MDITIIRMGIAVGPIHMIGIIIFIGIIRGKSRAVWTLLFVIGD